MPKYLVTGTYTPEAIRAVREAGYESRVAAVTAMFKSLGGNPDGVWFTTDNEIVALVDLPDDAAVFAMTSFAGSSGTIESGDGNALRLYTATEADAAIAAKVDYTPPGS